MNLAAVPPVRRHARRARRSAIVAIPAAAAATLALLVLAGPLAAAAGLVGASVVLAVCVWRAFAAADADAQEERWLRTVLGRIDPDAGEEDEGESPDDLLVF
jgi:hypothetical protein